MAALLLFNTAKAFRTTFVPLSTRSMSSAAPPLLLSPSQLSGLVSSGDRVAILDASWHMPNSPRKGREEFLSKCIPGAQYIDLDEVASPNELGLKHMMPPGRLFADACEIFGIEPSSHVVLYDAHGVFSSPRALFMFKSFGHEKSSILDGGLPRWEADGLPVETTPPPAETKKSTYPTPSLDESAIKSYEQIVKNALLNPSLHASELVLDARSHERYLGTAPEPRPGLSSGHIPNSFSLPFNAFLQAHTSPTKYTTYLPPSEIRKALIESVGNEQAELIIRGERPVTASCGSGMTAGVIWLGLKLLGVGKIGLYDESWTGYASRESSKIEKSS